MTYNTHVALETRQERYFHRRVRQWQFRYGIFFSSFRTERMYGCCLTIQKIVEKLCSKQSYFLNAPVHRVRGEVLAVNVLSKTHDSWCLCRTTVHIMPLASVYSFDSAILRALLYVHRIRRSIALQVDVPVPTRRVRCSE